MSSEEPSEELSQQLSEKRTAAPLLPETRQQGLSMLQTKCRSTSFSNAKF